MKDVQLLMIDTKYHRCDLLSDCFREQRLPASAVIRWPTSSACRALLLAGAFSQNPIGLPFRRIMRGGLVTSILKRAELIVVYLALQAHEGLFEREPMEEDFQGVICGHLLKTGYSPPAGG